MLRRIWFPINLAREVFYKQLPLLQFILKGGLPTTIKAGLQLRGFDAGVPRKPLLPLDSAGQNELAALIKQLNG